MKCRYRPFDNRGKQQSLHDEMYKAGMLEAGNVGNPHAAARVTGFGRRKQPTIGCDDRSLRAGSQLAAAGVRS